MNGGQVASRGFLLQTLIALLETLDSLDRLISIQLEPATAKDKTDLVFEYKDGKKKAVQVKSSQNQIGLPDAKKWASSLKNDFVANEYELCLIGPCSGDLTTTKEIDGVMIPVPKSLDVAGLREQAAHRLSRYCHRSRIGVASPVMRELIVDGLIGKLSLYSTAGTPLAASEVASVFATWMDAVEEEVRREVEKLYGNSTLTDVDALKEYSAQFDRSALQDALRSCGSYKDFALALTQLVELLNTGRVDGQFVTKRRADFANREWQQILSDVYHEVRGLREWYTALVRSGQIDESTCTCNFRKNSMHDDFDAKKRNIIRLLNELLSDAGLPNIRGVP